MNKTSLFLVLLLTIFSTSSYAEKVLTKELITSFQKMSEQWETLQVDDPELSASLEDFDFTKPEQIIAQLKSSKAYPQIKSMLAQHDFSSIEEYYNIAIRIMGGMMNYQMQAMPQGMNLESMVQMLKQNIAQMQASNAPSSMIDEMKKQLADMEINMIKMKEAMKNTSVEDKKFFSENAQWIMSALEEN